ncbi:MAG: hypothetical protein E3K37_00395 [Candidatus Kuenenia sp.]|nr:hypothetical protein [Candidatus Kuenenia hertensis]
MFPKYDTDYYDEVVEKMFNCGDPEKMGMTEYLCFWLWTWETSSANEL